MKTHQKLIFKNKIKFVGSETYPDQYYNYEYRLNNIRLIWCKQVKEILKKNFNFSKNLKINDFGCCYFPFYKELKLSNLKHNYFGFDLDKKIIQLGLKKFPELKKKYKNYNIESYEPIRKANISIVSSLLEHVNDPKKVLEYIIKNTKDCLILRIPISEKGYKNIIKASKKNDAWIFNIFKKKDIIDQLEKNNFNLKFYIDKSSRKNQIGSNFIKSLKKKIIILKAIKK